jgi:hypothetical protein
MKRRYLAILAGLGIGLLGGVGCSHQHGCTTGVCDCDPGPYCGPIYGGAAGPIGHDGHGPGGHVNGPVNGGTTIVAPSTGAPLNGGTSSQPMPKTTE